MKRALLGLLAVAMTCVTVVSPAAAELPTVPCDRVTGPTAADAATGQQLNRLLSKTMDGHMGAYETSCARIIVQTVKARGLPERAAVLAITTAIVESNLRNVDGGDLDSVGLFQQRDSWGTRADRLKAEVSTGKFLNALLDTTSWSTRPIGEVCQAVQRSAYPDRYAVQVSDAYIIVDALWDLAAAAERTGLSVISREFPDLDVFAKADDGSFLHKHFDGEKWTGGWANLQGRFKSNPAAYSAGPGRIELLGVGLDGELWQNTWTSAGWSGWKDTGGGTIQWTPAVTSRGGNTLDVFAVNTAEQVVHRHFDGSAWGQWRSIGGTASAPPAAIALGPDRINVLVRDADGTLATNMWTRTHDGWWGWRDRGRHISGAPSVSARSTQLMDVFVRDGAKTLQHIVSTNGGTDYSAPEELGATTLTTPPTSVSMYDKRIDVFSRAANGHLYQRIWSDYNTGTPSGWYNWVDLGEVG